jgi:phospholipid/cholesterol/gamma-HCH transport system substrate-binding protein
VATDPKTAKDIQSTIHNASEASARANRVLKVLNDPHVRIDELHSAKGGTWRTNLGVSLEPTEDTALYVGGASVGDDNKLDLQLIKKRNAWDFSAGAMQGKFGIGLGYDLVSVSVCTLSYMILMMPRCVRRRVPPQRATCPW